MNRIHVELDDYHGLTLSEITSSPDGSLREDVLAGLRQEERRLDGASGKFSGDVLFDIEPRHIGQLRIVITDLVGDAQIALRGISLSRRKYSNTGSLQSTRIDSPEGQCYFSTEQSTVDTLTSITHQFSFDGVHFQVASPDSTLNVGGPFWYRAVLERADSNFEQASQPVRVSGTDPAISPNYNINGITTTDLGAGIIERVITFDDVTGAVLLRETPLPGTITVHVGATLAGGETYSFANNTVTFSSAKTGVSLRYQTSALSTAGLSAAKTFTARFFTGRPWKKSDDNDPRRA